MTAIKVPAGYRLVRDDALVRAYRDGQRAMRAKVWKQFGGSLGWVYNETTYALLTGNTSKEAWASYLPLRPLPKKKGDKR
jgi:hypothetical protein